MSAAESDTKTKAINDARALLATLVAGDIHEIHIMSGDTEVFIARQDGRPNPMRAVAANPSHQAASLSQLTDVNAPHVSTLVDILAAGAVVASGAWVATISVLDDALHIMAPTAGRVEQIYAERGALLEYGSRILSIAGDE